MTMFSLYWGCSSRLIDDHWKHQRHRLYFWQKSSFWDLESLVSQFPQILMRHRSCWETLIHRRSYSYSVLLEKAFVSEFDFIQLGIRESNLGMRNQIGRTDIDWKTHRDDTPKVWFQTGSAEEKWSARNGWRNSIGSVPTGEIARRVRAYCTIGVK